MAELTIFALFDDALAALGAASALEREGLSRDAISLIVPDPRGRYARPADPGTPNARVFEPLPVPDFGPAAISGPLAANGEAAPAPRRFLEALREGRAVVAVAAAEEDGARAAELLRRFGGSTVDGAEEPAGGSDEPGEYIEWRADGHLSVRVHRRVLAGLEGESERTFRGILLGSMSPGEVVVEDYELLSESSKFDPRTGAIAGQTRHSLPAVGAFRVGDDPRVNAADRERFDREFPAPQHVFVVFRRSGRQLEGGQVYVQPGAAAPRLTDTVEHPARKRYLWAAAAGAAFLLIIGAAYVSADRDARKAGAHQATAKPAERPPLADWKPAQTPPPPAAATQPATPAPTPNGADRAAENTADQPLSREEQRREIRSALDRWRRTLLDKNVEAHAALYAPSVAPYFREARVSRGEIASEVRRMLGRYGPMTSFQISDVQIAPIDDTHAVASFLKRWQTAHDTFSGAERAQLRFVREDGRWLIASEQEIKVYWARKK